MNTPNLRLLAIALSFASIAAAQSAPPAQSPINLPARFNAVAYTQSGPTRSFGLTIYAEQLSTDEEVHTLATTLKQKGQDALVSMMEGMKEKGRVSPAASTGAAMEIVRIRPLKGGGQRIVLVGNRPITIGNLMPGRLSDYKFSLVILNLDANGKGTGLLAPACRIKFKNDRPEVENYGQKPLRLEGVQPDK
ncbi:MAG TPA: hypothetical protein VF753_11165 [Terriglobales bacterium]